LYDNLSPKVANSDSWGFLGNPEVMTFKVTASEMENAIAKKSADTATFIFGCRQNSPLS